MKFQIILSLASVHRIASSHTIFCQLEAGGSTNGIGLCPRLGMYVLMVARRGRWYQNPVL
jgi:hypothetical protein